MLFNRVRFKSWAPVPVDFFFRALLWAYQFGSLLFPVLARQQPRCIWDCGVLPQPSLHIVQHSFGVLAAFEP